MRRLLQAQKSVLHHSLNGASSTTIASTLWVRRRHHTSEFTCTQAGVMGGLREEQEPCRPKGTGGSCLGEAYNKRLLTSPQTRCTRHFEGERDRSNPQ
jgi:hypothetical protein